MPMVQEMIANISGKEINPQEVNPDDAVALGAAIQGTLRQIEEVTSGTSGTTAKEDIPDAVIDRFISPDGAPKVTVVDGATHNLGLVVVNSEGNNVIHVMIPKMTAVPCEKVGAFGTVEENQPSALVVVVQGLEDDMLKDEIPDFEEYKLGECPLELPCLPRGSQVQVTYKYNLDQTLEVTAEGPDGRTANTTIQRETLDEAEVIEATQNLQHLEVE